MTNNYRHIDKLAGRATSLFLKLFFVVLIQQIPLFGHVW